MKKIVSLALAAVLLLGVVPMVNAAEVTDNHDYSNGTAITLVGTGTEEYTVTVPAKMAPGDTGIVKAEGTWAADKYLLVHAASSVTLTYGAQTIEVDISGGSFSLIGNSVDPISSEVEIAIEDASRLFGTWEGVAEYNVWLVEKGDANGDGVIDQSDIDYIDQIIAKAIVLTDEEEAAVLGRADIDGDGSLAANDALYIDRLLKGYPIIAPATTE